MNQSNLGEACQVRSAAEGQQLRDLIGLMGLVWETLETFKVESVSCKKKGTEHPNLLNKHLFFPHLCINLLILFSSLGFFSLWGE